MVLFVLAGVLFLGQQGLEEAGFDENMLTVFRYAGGGLIFLIMIQIKPEWMNKKPQAIEVQLDSSSWSIGEHDIDLESEQAASFHLTHERGELLILESFDFY